MNRRIARLFALLVTAACVGAACGGKVVVDVMGDGVSSSTTASSSSGGGAGSGGSGGGGCDAASHTIDDKGYEVSCTAASDCLPVYFGNLCSSCTCPLGAAINVADKMKYEAEAQAKAVPTGPGGCFCPASTPVCVNGQCAVMVP